MRLATRYLDRQAQRSRRRARASCATRARARRRCRSACSATRPRSCRSSSAAACARHGHRPDLRARSRQRLPARGLDASSAWRAAQQDPAAARGARGRGEASIAAHVDAMLAFQRQGIPTFDYGNNIRQVAFDEGVTDAFAFPGFVPAYIRPLFCEGKGPFRWVALSGDPEDIYRTDRKVKRAVSRRTRTCSAGSTWRGERIAFQGLPARICWLGLGRAPSRGPRVQRDGAHAASSRRRSSSAATISTPAPSRRRTARPKRWRTAPTRCPTGRCSTRCSTPPAARRGCRSTTAAASAWATRSTRAWSSSATAPTPRRGGSSACCGTIRRPA